MRTARRLEQFEKDVNDEFNIIGKRIKEIDMALCSLNARVDKHFPDETGFCNHHLQGFIAQDEGNKAFFGCLKCKRLFKTKAEALQNPCMSMKGF